MEINIRTAKTEELDALLQVYSIAKKFMETHGNRLQWTGADAITRHTLETFLEWGQLYVGETGGEIVFAFAYIQGEDPTYKVITEGGWLNREPYGTVHRLAASGSVRGVVKMITEWALARCPNLRIDTHHHNTVMQNALSKASFTRCGVIFLENGDPRIAYQITKGGTSMNETLKVLETRRSCRNFDPERMVPEETLQAILKAGTYAATGMGRQSPIILAVTNKELRDRLAKENAAIMGAAIDPFYGAPVVLIVLADTAVPTYLYDGSLVLGNLMNAAESLGVNSIWIHRAKEEFESEFGKQLLADLGIEGSYEGIGHCALGYALSPIPSPAPRKENYVTFIR